MQVNGKTKIALSVGAALAVLAAVFTAGVSWSQVQAHVADRERHETGSQKETRIDNRVRMHLRPIEVKLNEMDKKIDRLLDERRDK